MVVELSQYSNVLKRTILDRAQASWTWSAGPGRLEPGSQLSIEGKVINLGESNSVVAAAVLGTYGFTKGGLTAPGKPEATFSGVAGIPNKPGTQRDGTINPYFTITFSLNCGRLDAYFKLCFDRYARFRIHPRQS
ncbi:MAG: hypothetical protein KDC66_22790, partial [Phaeodactylibacter sp.]|nr:hypothetical protein [Phaeodactylibacter sp.]